MSHQQGHAVPLKEVKHIPEPEIYSPSASGQPPQRARIPQAPKAHTPPSRGEEMAGAASVCLKSRLLMATTGSCDRTRVFSAPPIYHRLGLVGCQARAQTTSSSLGKNPKDVYTESTYPTLRVFWEQDMGRAVCPPMDKEDFADRSRTWAAMAKGHRATFVRAPVGQGWPRRRSDHCEHGS